LPASFIKATWPWIYAKRYFDAVALSVRVGCTGAVQLMTAVINLALETPAALPYKNGNQMAPE